MLFRYKKFWTRHSIESKTFMMYSIQYWIQNTMCIIFSRTCWVFFLELIGFPPEILIRRFNIIKSEQFRRTYDYYIIIFSLPISVEAYKLQK